MSITVLCVFAFDYSSLALISVNEVDLGRCRLTCVFADSPSPILGWGNEVAMVKRSRKRRRHSVSRTGDATDHPLLYEDETNGANEKRKQRIFPYIHRFL